jgi:hypothetical protein
MRFRKFNDSDELSEIIILSEETPGDSQDLAPAESKNSTSYQFANSGFNKKFYLFALILSLGYLYSGQNNQCVQEAIGIKQGLRSSLASQESLTNNGTSTENFEKIEFVQIQGRYYKKTADNIYMVNGVPTFYKVQRR